MRSSSRDTGAGAHPVSRELALLRRTRSKALLESTSELSAKINKNLLYSRVVFDPEAEIEQECEAAWDAVEETQTY